MAFAIGDWAITGAAPDGAVLQNGGKLGGLYKRSGSD